MLGGPVPPCTLLTEIVCTRGEYVTMSNGVLNLNFLVLLLSEILGVCQIYIRGPTPPGRSLAETFFCTQSEYFTISNCVFNVNILAPVVSEILDCPKFMLGGPVPPCTLLPELSLYPRRVRYYV